MYTDDQIKIVSSKVNSPLTEERVDYKYAYEVSHDINRAIAKFPDLVHYIPKQPNEAVYFIKELLISDVKEKFQDLFGSSWDDSPINKELIDLEKRITLEVGFDKKSAQLEKSSTELFSGISQFTNKIVSAFDQLLDIKGRVANGEDSIQLLSRAIAESYVENALILNLDIDFNRVQIEPFYKESNTEGFKLENRTTLGRYNPSTRSISVNLFYLNDLAANLDRKIVNRESEVRDIHDTIAHEMFHDYLRLNFPKVAYIAGSKIGDSYEEYLKSSEEIACRIYGATYAIHHQRRANLVLGNLWRDILNSQEHELPEWANDIFLFPMEEYKDISFESIFTRIRTQMGIGINFQLKLAN